MEKTLEIEHVQTFFTDANSAFEYYFNLIKKVGMPGPQDTLRWFNASFYILNPTERLITSPNRNWSEKYAEREWLWYLSKERSVKELKKFAPIWDKMHNGDDIVNSNYGALWSENDQLGEVVKMLKKDPTTRRAYITLYDGKRIYRYEKDTPCTLTLGFKIVNNRLHMNVHMRSNDLWYGFCNDQYCFSKLQEYIAKALGVEVGWYYHHADDLHLYKEQQKIIL